MDINRSASSLPPSNPGVESPSTSVTCVPGWNISRCAGGRDHTALSSSLDFAARASRSDTVVLDSMLSMRSSARFSVQSMRLSPSPCWAYPTVFVFVGFDDTTQLAVFTHLICLSVFLGHVTDCTLRRIRASRTSPTAWPHRTSRTTCASTSTDASNSSGVV